jgi:site-specific recombinase XerD
MARENCPGNDYQFQVILKLLGDIPVAEVVRDDIRNIRDILVRLPANITKNSRYESKSVEEILTMKSEPMTTTSVNKFIAKISSIYIYANAAGTCSHNPAHVMKIRKEIHPSEERLAYPG